MSHTPEPWSINDYPQPDSSIAIGAQGTPLIARVIFRDVSINEQKANARRIVACVNACGGFSTETLEATVANGSGVIRVLQQQRDDLLAALKGVMELIGHPSLESDETLPQLIAANTAIAKAEAA